MTHLTCVWALMIYMAMAPLSSYAQSRAAITEIEKFASKIVRDERLAAKPVIELYLKGELVTDQTLVHLKEFPNLRLLDLTLARVTDDGLKHLKSLNDLEVLELNLTRISETGLAHLKDLPKLHTLSLFCTAVSSDGLNRLKDFKHLHKLVLDRETDFEQAIAELSKALPELKIDQGNGNTADRRARRYFSIVETANIDWMSIRSAILSKLPSGSSKEEIYELLKSTGIDDDPHGGYSLLNGDIICRIGYDPNDGWIVHSHYGITFRMDAKSGLKDVEVKTWLTGP